MVEIAIGEGGAGSYKATEPLVQRWHRRSEGNRTWWGEVAGVVTVGTAAQTRRRLIKWNTNPRFVA